MLSPSDMSTESHSLLVYQESVSCWSWLILAQLCGVTMLGRLFFFFFLWRGGSSFLDDSAYSKAMSFLSFTVFHQVSFTSLENPHVNTQASFFSSAITVCLQVNRWCPKSWVGQDSSLVNTEVFWSHVKSARKAVAQTVPPEDPDSKLTHRIRATKAVSKTFLVWLNLHYPWTPYFNEVLT